MGCDIIFWMSIRKNHRNFPPCFAESKTQKRIIKYGIMSKAVTRSKKMSFVQMLWIFRK